ncbi:AAA family ATPase [Macrococcoides canis]|nr:AAA family ATPase [Macrococcus canis]
MINKGGLTLKIVILRGNSGSGKTTIAKKLQKILGEKAILISQDVLRRKMLLPDAVVGEMSVKLNQAIVDFSVQHFEYIIIEGIYSNKKHGKWLKEYTQKFESYAYYFDISFEETLLRHQNKVDVNFGKEEMEQWYIKNDVLGIKNEKIILEKYTIEDTVSLILDDIY